MTCNLASRWGTQKGVPNRSLGARPAAERMEALHEGPPSGIYYTRSHDWFRRVGGTALQVLTSQNPTSKNSALWSASPFSCMALEPAARDQDVSVEAVLRRTFIHLQASQKPRAI